MAFVRGLGLAICALGALLLGRAHAQSENTFTLLCQGTWTAQRLDNPDLHAEGQSEYVYTVDTSEGRWYVCRRNATKCGGANGPLRSTRADLFLDGQRRGQVSYTIEINRVNGSIQYHYVQGMDRQDFYGRCQKTTLISPASTQF